MPIEMLSGFTANISTETQIQQNRRYTTIQLDIIHTGDCLNILKTLPDDSVHCCVTSPPYYALRDYGMEAQIGRETTPKEYISRLTEVFTEVRRVLRPDGTLWLNISDTYAGKGNQGDYVDPKNPKSNRGNAGFSDEERGKFTELLNAGFTDTWRTANPDVEGVYSWWSYRFNARKNNAGWRIDYFLVSDAIAANVRDTGIRGDIFGSDHCPVTLTLEL